MVTRGCIGSPPGIDLVVPRQVDLLKASSVRSILSDIVMAVRSAEQVVCEMLLCKLRVPKRWTDIAIQY